MKLHDTDTLELWGGVIRPSAIPSGYAPVRRG